jgi:hypothetical protein
MVRQSAAVGRITLVKGAKSYVKSRNTGERETERIFEAGIGGFQPQTQEQKRRTFQERIQQRP